MPMTVPATQQRLQSPAYRLISKMEAGKEDVIVICNSDSTGITGDYDGSAYYNKWIYKIAKYLAAKYPAYTVRYYDVVPAFYNLPVILQTGTGSQTLYFYNAAFSGTQPTYLMGSRLQAVFNVRANADLIIFNHGHNTDGNMSANVQQGMTMAAIYTMLGFHPSAGVLVVSQNPIRDTDTGTNRSAGARQAATAGGFGLLDVNQMYLKAGKPKAWWRIVPSTGEYDTIHPGSIGDQKIFELARPMFTWPLLPMSHKAGLLSAQNLLLNGDFQAWSDSSAAPDNWTAYNVALSKNTTSGQFEKGLYSLKMTTNSALGGYMRQSLPAALVRQLAGRVVTLAVRVYVGSDNTLSSAARMSIVEVDNSTPYGIPTGGRDGFIWKAVVVLIPASATTITVQLMADAAGNAAGSVCTFDRVILCAGNIPQDFYS